MYSKKTLASAAMIGLLSLGGVPGLVTEAQADELQSLSNMERERAQMVRMFVDAGVSSSQRHRRIDSIRRRLVDLERMVLRDDRLLGNTHRLVRLTFNNYELSFLVHASAEAGQAPMEHWLNQIGLSNEVILTAKVGRR